MISNEALETQSPSQIAWLKSLGRNTLSKLGFITSQIDIINSTIGTPLYSCPDFERLGISYGNLLLCDIGLTKLNTALRGYIALHYPQYISQYYTKLADTISLVLTEIFDHTELARFSNCFDISLVNNDYVKSLSLPELVWLSNAPINSLRKLGFTDGQIVYCKIYSISLGTGKIPGFDTTSISVAALMECGIPRNHLKNGIRNRFIEEPTTVFFSNLWESISTVTHNPQPASSINLDVQTDSELGIESVTTEPISTPVQFIEVPPSTTTINYCERDDERGVVYISTSDTGIETSETAHDLSVKYLNCYCLYQDIVIKIYNILTEGDNIYVSFTATQGGYDQYKQVNRPISPDFNFSLPKLGLINTDFDVFYVERLHKRESPARYRKGLIPEYLTYKNLCSFENLSLKKDDLVKSLIYGSNSFNSVAEYIFKPITFTYKEALESILNADRVATSFSSAYAIKIDLKINRVILLRYNYVIGTYSIRYNKWTMLTNAFNKSLIDLGVPL